VSPQDPRGQYRTIGASAWGATAAQPGVGSRQSATYVKFTQAGAELFA
jgi:hypothetical protein